MFFKKKNNDATQIVNSHLNEALTILRKSPYYSNDITVDITALMYLITDYALLSANKNREKISANVYNWMVGSQTNDVKMHFSCRLNFYTSILKGSHVHGDCVPGMDLNQEDTDPFLRCVVAFGDCMLASEYIRNYDEAPAYILGITESVDYAQNTLYPFLNIIIELFKDIYDNA